MDKREVKAERSGERRTKHVGVDSRLIRAVGAVVDREEVIRWKTIEGPIFGIIIFYQFGEEDKSVIVHSRCGGSHALLVVLFSPNFFDNSSPILSKAFLCLGAVLSGRSYQLGVGVSPSLLGAL